MKKETKEEQTDEFPAFADAERNLLEAGFTFAVVDGPTPRPAEQPLAA